MDIQTALDFIIFDVLTCYYQETKDDDLGMLLGDLTGDPAAWDHWVKALETVTSKDIGISEEEARKAMLALMQDYNDNFHDNLSHLIKHFNS